MRGSGPGGQKRNKTDSCVRITHIPSGLVVYNCDTPSQHRNRTAAFRQLADQIIAHYFPEAEKAREASGTEEVRAYKIEDDLVVDHSGFKSTYRQIGKSGLEYVIIQRKHHLK